MIIYPQVAGLDSFDPSLKLRDRCVRSLRTLPKLCGTGGRYFVLGREASILADRMRLARGSIARPCPFSLANKWLCHSHLQLAINFLAFPEFRTFLE